jgi:nicotinate-nucleotide pyrophosphorylase (carboxylating)
MLMTVENDLMHMIYQDIGFEDLTTKALIPPDMEIKAQITCKEDGVVAGVDLVSSIFRKFALLVSLKKQDGEKVNARDMVMGIEGNAQALLSLERTALNLLMRMSGIATLTSQMLEKAVSVNPDVILAGTRKTTPGMQFFEKDAIRCGGGDTHRYRLDDCVLIKDNHLALVGDVELAVEKARKYASFTKKIEIEVETLEDAVKAVKAGADIVMLDNMGSDDIKNVLATLESLKLRKKVLIEVSGGINPDNIVEYSKTGIDIISTGYLTHSARALDISLEIIL